tara:strand:+ start:29490 stop:30680 length:1191 start_codon:yes stop_codon:yes gene_type:complete
MTFPQSSDLAKYWSLDPNTVFLNHGSFGATPTAILDEQSRIRNLMERDPVRFVEREYLEMWNDARENLASFLNADVEGMTFVTNATQGVNTVLRSLQLRPGDEIIVPNHAYQACWNAVEFVTKRAKAKVVVVDIPFRVKDPQEIIDLILSSVTDKTVLALIDTVTSPTGMRMPFEILTKELQSREVDVLLDAAHGVGLIDINLRKLSPAYCTGNCHKWLCTPKGSAFLHIREDRKDRIRPLNISHGYSFEGTEQEKFEFEFTWTGTQDPSPWLCIPKSIEYMEGLVKGGWPEIMRRNHSLVIEGRDIICESLGTTPPFPESMVSALASIEVPTNGDLGVVSLDGDPFHNHLLDKYNIQVPVMPWQHHGVKYLRISAQLYNHIDQYKYLADVLSESL